MLWHCLLCLRADDNLENLNTNLTDINHDLWTKNVSYAQEHKSTVNEAKDEQADKLIKPQEMSGNKTHTHTHTYTNKKNTKFQVECI